jgi:hypothetical protein
MVQATPIDQFCRGRLGLPELLTEIDKTFSKGDSSEQSALLDSWRKNELKKVLDRRIYNLIDEKLETAYSKTRLGAAAEDKTVIAPSAASLRPGYLLNGRFILEEVLGQGGMGVVYRATDLRKKEAQDRDPNVAIKVLNDDFRHHPDSFKALQREARKAQSLAHPNIITVYDFDREGSLIYLTMEYLSGTPLDKQMKSLKGPRPVAQVLPITKAVAAALACAHENGIVHSDLKPANIFITDNGRVKVIDFGIARAVKRPEAGDDREATVFDPGQLRALTPAYASVEMIEGRPPDARDDIFALGCITYELITGRHPYGRVMATDARDEGIVPKRPSQLSSRQWRALAGTLSLTRENRTPTAQQFINEFAASAKKMASAAVLGGWAAAAVLVGLTMLYFIGEVSFSFGSHEAEVAISGTETSAAEAERRAAEEAKKAASQLAAAEAAREQAARQAAEAARRETERQTAEAARKEAERQAAAEATRKEAERQAAAEATRKEAERQTAAEAARKEAERQTAGEVARKEAERQTAGEVARKEAERQAAAEAARKEAERQAAAEAAGKEAERQAAAEAAGKEAERQAAAEAARKAAERQAVEAARSDGERQAAEAARKEAERKAAETARKEAERQAAETVRKEAERKAADAARKEAERQAALAASKETERRAAEAAKNEAARKAAEAARRDAEGAKPGDQVAVLNVPKPTETSLLGAWCASGVKIRLSSTEWRFQLPGGEEARLSVTQYRVAGDKILLYSRDGQGRETITEFGGIGGDQMTQIRGKFVDADSWNNYNRIFKRC